MKCKTHESNDITQYYCALTDRLDHECNDIRQKHFLIDNRDVRKTCLLFAIQMRLLVVYYCMQIHLI